MNGVVIIGGGLAGLAAAQSLVGRGFPVTLLESRNRLGGRATSFEDRAQSEVIDNCQHVSMGCCTNLAHFCQSVGIGDLFRIEKSLTFIGPNAEVCEFRADPLPAPFHLTRAFGRLKYLGWGERVRLVMGLRALARTRPEDLLGVPFSKWLDEHRQSPRVQELFWHVVLVSAVSESLDRIDAFHARKVFVDGFLANRRGWEVHIPAAPLDHLYGEPILNWLRQLGGEVRLLAGVEAVELNEEQTLSVRLRNGDRCDDAEDVIVAVPHHRILDLLPEATRGIPFFERISRIESAPIASVHLWFDRSITDLPHATLVGRMSQWVFRRPQEVVGSDVSKPDLHYYQVVISASRGIREQGHEATIAAVVDDLRAIWPEASSAKLIHSRVVIEHRAVFAPTPGVESLRPTQTTPIARLHLAGDWTATGWPATMEGAVRSGYLAAESVLRRRGRHETLVRPDLPVEWPARWAFGL
jgi:squalene-associated FAD-dependent desaturase